MGTHLESGTYSRNLTEKVTVWPAPDADGPGDVVWEDNFDGGGNFVGRSAKKDKDGREIRSYPAPDGFKNLTIQEPGSGGQKDCWVRLDERGGIWRHPRTGEAAEIRPGTVLIEKSDGDFQLLTDEYSQYLYSKSHDKVSDDNTPDLVKPQDDEDQAAADAERVDREEFEAWKSRRNSRGTEPGEVDSPNPLDAKPEGNEE